MIRIEESSRLIPKPAEPRLSDLFSETVSDASKGNAARFYAEMMIDLFLSERLKKELDASSLEKLTLGEHIQKISPYTDSVIISTLWRIKDFGDKASHYSPGSVLTTTDADKAVEDAVGLIVQILTDELIKNPLNSYPGRATLFSTILPRARAQVLSHLLKKCPESEYDYYRFLVNKYGLALTKSERYPAARRNLDSLLKKKLIDIKYYQQEVETIFLLDKSIKYPGQPIAQRMEDVARNFNAVLASFNTEDRNENLRLIEILRTLVNDIIPSGFNHRKTQKLLF